MNINYDEGVFFFWVYMFFFNLNLQGQYLIVLCSFKEQLQQHVRIHAVEAVMACREIENTLQALTGMCELITKNIFFHFFFLPLLIFI